MVKGGVDKMHFQELGIHLDIPLSGYNFLDSRCALVLAFKWPNTREKGAGNFSFKGGEERERDLVFLEYWFYPTIIGPEFQSWVFLCAFFSSSPSLFIFALDSSGIMLLCVNWLLSFVINNGAFTDGIVLDITGILQITQSVVTSGEMMSLGNVVATDATSLLFCLGRRHFNKTLAPITLSFSPATTATPPPTGFQRLSHTTGGLENSFSHKYKTRWWWLGGILHAVRLPTRDDCGYGGSRVIP
ncbi:hypothetical protein R6Q57_011202 [Mikania cordata]